MSGKKHLFVFDIETIPDAIAAKRYLGHASDDETELRQALAQHYLDISDGRSNFPRPPFHQVVAISILQAEISYETYREQYHLKQICSLGSVEGSEADLLKAFFTAFGQVEPRLVSFNGRGFDLPVLKYRAMVHGITSTSLHLAGDKWNSYQSRYSLDWHCDLLEALSDFGASTRVKLDEVCAALGLPGKIDTAGNDVLGLYESGKVQEIRDYCDTDVLNTYLVYLRWQLHRGILPPESYNAAIEGVSAFLSQNQEQEHWQKFWKAWTQSCGGQSQLP